MVVLVFQLHPEFSAWGNPRLVPEKGANWVNPKSSRSSIVGEPMVKWAQFSRNTQFFPGYACCIPICIWLFLWNLWIRHNSQTKISIFFAKHWTQPVGVPHLAVESAVDPPNWAPQLGRGPGSSPKPNSPAIACWWNASWAICCIPSLVGGFNPSEKY